MNPIIGSRLFITRLIALVVCLCVSAPESGLFAAVEPAGSGRSPLYLSLPLSEPFPEKLGTLEEVYQGDSGKTVFYIQDAHDVLDAQESIAGLIDHFVEKENVQTVFEEGFEGPVPTDEIFGRIQDSEVKRRVSYYLMDQLQIGGAEYAHINRKRDFRLVGADSQTDHFENVRRYAEAVRTQDEIENDLRAVEKQLENLLGQLRLKPLQDFLKLQKARGQNRIDFVVYLRELCRIYNSEQTESGALQKLYPAVTQTLRAIDTRQAEVLERVKKFGAADLFEEIRRLEKDLSGILAINPRAKKLYDYYEAIGLLSRLNKLSLSSEEYREAHATLKNFKTQELAEFLSAESRKTVILPRRWEVQLESAIEFYEAAFRRDEKIEEAIGGFLKSPDEKTAVLVYGGFHASRIREILKNSGMSYAVVSPGISRIEKRHQQYYRSEMSSKIPGTDQGAAAEMARPVTIFQKISAGTQQERLVIEEEIAKLGSVVKSLEGDLPQVAREAGLRLASESASRGELRLFEEAPQKSERIKSAEVLASAINEHFPPAQRMNSRTLTERVLSLAVGTQEIIYKYLKDQTLSPRTAADFLVTLEAEDLQRAHRILSETMRQLAIQEPETRLVFEEKLFSRFLESPKTRSFSGSPNELIEGPSFKTFSGRVAEMPYLIFKTPLIKSLDDAKILAIFPDYQKEPRFLSVPSAHFFDAITFAVFYERIIEGKKTLLVSHIQSDAYRHLRSDPELKRQYQDWRWVMRSVLEKYARENGYTRILSPVSAAIRERWQGIDANLAEIVYDTDMNKRGYRLVTTAEEIPWDEEIKTAQWWQKNFSETASAESQASVSAPAEKRSELRSDVEEWEDDSPLERVESFDVERRTDKIVNKLIKRWYRSKSKSMTTEIDALWRQTVRRFPIGTPGYQEALVKFNNEVLGVLEKAVSAQKELLDELSALSNGLFIYHAGIEREIQTREARQKFQDLYGTTVPEFPFREGDPFTPDQMTAVFAELQANTRHVDPPGAMFFYRLDDDPNYIKFIIRDGGAYTVRAAGVYRSIMGEEYPDEFGRIRKHGYHNVIDAVVRRRLGGEVIVEYDRKSERYYSGWVALSPWTIGLNQWVSENLSMPRFGFAAEIIGRPNFHQGVSKIKPKQGLKVKLLIPRHPFGESRPELRSTEKEQENLSDSSEIWADQWREEGQISILGEGFEAERAEVEKFFDGFFEEQLKENPAAKFLDLGTGRFFVPRIGLKKAEQFPGAKPEFHGVDFSEVDPAMIPKEKNVHFHKLKLENLRTAFEAESFEAATSSFGIEYSRDQEQTFKALSEVLKPGAPAAMVMHHPGSIISESIAERLWQIEELKKMDVIGHLLRYAKDPGPVNAENVIEAYGVLKETIAGARGKDTEILTEIRDQMEMILIAGENAIPALEKMRVDLEENAQMFQAFLENTAVFGDQDKDKLRAFLTGHGFEVRTLERFEVQTANHPVPLLIGWKMILVRTREPKASLPRAELREFLDYAEDFLAASLQAQNKQLYGETDREVRLRYENALKENQVIWEIIQSAAEFDPDWSPREANSTLVQAFEFSRHFQINGKTLMDYAAVDEGGSSAWPRSKEILQRGLYESLETSGLLKEEKMFRTHHAAARLLAIYEIFYLEKMTRISAENIVFRLNTLLRGYQQTKVVRQWTKQDTGNVFEMTGFYVGLDFEETAKHQVRVTITNPRKNSGIFPYLTAVMDQDLAADFLEDIKDVNDFLKRWPVLSAKEHFFISYKKMAFLSLFTAALSLIFGPAGGKAGLLIEFFVWATTGVIWLDIYQIKERVRKRIDDFADHVQESSGMWTVIAREDEFDSKENVENLGRSELRAMRTWEEWEKEYVHSIYLKTQGNASAAARILGWSRSNMSRYKKKHGLVFEPGFILDDLPEKTTQEWKRIYVIAAMIFYKGIKRRVTSATGVSHRILTGLLSEEEMKELVEGDSKKLIKKYQKELLLLLNKEEIESLLLNLFDAQEGLADHLEARAVFSAGRELIQDTDVLSRVLENVKTYRAEHLFETEESFKTATEVFRRRAAHGESLDQIFPEAAAVFMEAARIKIGQVPTDEQLLAAQALHKGRAVEMEPGEGKTLTVALAAYVNALEGRGVHVHTFNNYLAVRDVQEMGPVFDLLGITVGAITERTHFYRYDPFLRGGRQPDRKHLTATLHEAGGNSRSLHKKDIYLSDIVYGVKDLFIFDFLQDQKMNLAAQRVQRPEGPTLTILDEGDATLLDESSTPLILAYVDPDFSGAFKKEDYLKLYQTALALSENEDYVLDSLNENIELKGHGLSRAIHYLKYIAFDPAVLTELMRKHELGNLLHQALMAKHFNERDGDYIVKDKRVVLVDEFTGRVKEDYVLGNHRHQFIVAKELHEGKEVEMPAVTVHGGLITYQNYYRMMTRQGRFSMITGTLGNDAEEISKTYGINYVRIPKQHSSRMKEHLPLMYPTKIEKNEAVLRKVGEVHQRGNPVVVFVRRISDAHQLRDQLLQRNGIEAAVIDGLDFQEEIHALEQAGKRGRVTIATSVAGRGVNIRIDDEVRGLGGLVIIMTRRSKSKRIDDQAKLRTARRGDPGEVYWYLAEDDESFKRFHGQRASEEFLRKVRQHALFYDDMLDPYRQLFYEARQALADLLVEKNKWARDRDLLLVDLAWQRYLMELEYAMYQRPPEGYLVQVRDGFRFVREVLISGFEREKGLEAYREIEKKHPLPLNGFDNSSSRPELRTFQNAMIQYESYQSQKAESALPRIDAVSRIKAWLENPALVERRPITITRRLEKGGENMNVTLVHSPEAFKVAAIRAHRQSRPEDIYYLDLSENPETALEILEKHLNAFYPDRLFDVETGVGLFPFGDQDVLMVTLHDDGRPTEWVRPAGRTQQVFQTPSGVSSEEVYNQFTRQTPADNRKLLAAKFRSRDPRDQDLKRSELRLSENSIELLYAPAKKPSAAMIDFRDLVTFTQEEIREAAIMISQREDVRFVVHNVDVESDRLLYFKNIFRFSSNVVWTRGDGESVFRSLGSKFRENSIIAFARKSRDLSGFSQEALKTVRFFALSPEIPGTFAVALSYDPDQIIFQGGVSRDGNFYILQPFLSGLARDYLNNFAFATSA